MPPRDNIVNDKSFQKFLHNDSYYQHIFKKTEKIISVVFYILNNIEVEKKSETHTSNLASKAHFAHENALRTLEAKPANAREVLEQFAQSLIGLESTLRVVSSAAVVSPEVLAVVSGEIGGVLKGLNQYINPTEAFPSNLFGGIADAPVARRSGLSTDASVTRRATALRPNEATTTLPVIASGNDRRVRISTILGAKGEATIKDISEIITDVSEKTIQRELNAMIEESVVKRQGERRWSKYSLNS
jgi:DNA-binding transcriptional ArsR family regulator